MQTKEKPMKKTDHMTSRPHPFIQDLGVPNFWQPWAIFSAHRERISRIIEWKLWKVEKNRMKVVKTTNHKPYPFIRDVINSINSIKEFPSRTTSRTNRSLPATPSRLSPKRVVTEETAQSRRCQNNLRRNPPLSNLMHPSLKRQSLSYPPQSLLHPSTPRKHAIRRSHHDRWVQIALLREVVIM